MMRDGISPIIQMREMSDSDGICRVSIWQVEYEREALEVLTDVV